MFLKLRKKFIGWLAGKDLAVITNCRVYDYVLDSNAEIKGLDNIFYLNNVMIQLESAIRDEVNLRISLRDQGIDKQGNAFVLKA